MAEAANKITYIPPPSPQQKMKGRLTLSRLRGGSRVGREVKTAALAVCTQGGRRAARCAEKRPYYLGQVEIRAENTRRIPGAKPLALGIRPGRVQATGPGVNQPPRRFVLSHRRRPPDAGRASLHKAAWQRKCLNYQRNECLFWAQKKENGQNFYLRW